MNALRKPPRWAVSLAAFLFLCVVARVAVATDYGQDIEWASHVSKPDSLFPQDTVVVRVRTSSAVPAADSMGLQFSVDSMSTWTWMGSVTRPPNNTLRPNRYTDYCFSDEPLGFVRDQYCVAPDNPGLKSSIAWQEANWEFVVITGGVYYFRSAIKDGGTWQYSDSCNAFVNFRPATEDSSRNPYLYAPVQLWADSTQSPWGGK